jgi:ATP-dependent NAD(P)H-hydrate dehydratase
MKTINQFERLHLPQNPLSGKKKKKKKKKNSLSVVQSMLRQVLGPQLAPIIAALPPPLAGHSHKGLHGRIGILGGSRDYGGAAYFAAMGALRSGADLCRVFTTPEASPVIKGYSPDVMVHACAAEGDGEAGLGERDARVVETKKEEKKRKKKTDCAARITHSKKFLTLLFRLSDITEADTAALAVLRRWTRTVHCMVLGPGIGRSARMERHLRAVLGGLAGAWAECAVAAVVIDADALTLAAANPGLITDLGAARSVVTPNAVEYAALCRAVGVEGGEPKAFSDFCFFFVFLCIFLFLQPTVFVVFSSPRTAV